MSQTLQLQQNPMRQIKIGKLVLNIGLGKSGEAIERGKKVLEQITGQKVCQRKARKTIRDFGIHKGEPIAVLVTVRGKRAEEILEKLLEARDKRLGTSCFDENGSISFGIKEHIEIPGIKYDPSIGILGMNVSILLEKPGYRVARRLRKRSKIGIRQRVSREEAIKFLSERFGAIVE